MAANLHLLNSDREFSVDYFTLISDRHHELNEVQTIVLEKCKHKHCAILKFGEQYKIIDMCSFQTCLNIDGQFKLIEPLKFYDINDKDEIKLGPYRFVFNNPAHDSDSSFVPGSPDSNENSKNESSDLQHVELPETQDFKTQPLSQDFETQDMLADVKFDTNEKKNEEKPNKMKLLSALNKNIVTNMNATVDSKYSLHTQPVWNLPPTTRMRKRKQEELKPKTRPVHQIELSENILENYHQETQPFVPVKLEKTKKIKMKRDLEFEREYRIKSQKRPKINPIMLSEEEDEENDLSFTAYLKRKKFKVKEEESPTQLSMIDDIPNVSSQFLNDSDILSQINESQHKFDDPLIKYEEEEEKPAPVNKFFGKTHKTQIKKKILKYGSDDDD